MADHQNGAVEFEKVLVIPRLLSARIDEITSPIKALTSISTMISTIPFMSKKAANPRFHDVIVKSDETLPIEYSKNLPFFHKETHTWKVAFDGISVSIKDKAGMTYIYHLIHNPYRPISAVELKSVLSGQSKFIFMSTAIEVIDDKTLKDYYDRIKDLDMEIEEARKINDRGKLEKLTLERETILNEINKSTGLNRRIRKSSIQECTRKSVSAAIHRALKDIEKVHHSLWIHLYESLKIGTVLSYTPK